MTQQQTLLPLPVTDAPLQLVQMPQHHSNSKIVPTAAASQQSRRLRYRPPPPPQPLARSREKRVGQTEQCLGLESVASYLYMVLFWA